MSQASAQSTTSIYAPGGDAVSGGQNKTLVWLALAALLLFFFARRRKGKK